MSAPVHFEVEVLYRTTVGPACGYDAPGKLTDDPELVTCGACRKLCGFDEGLTEVARGTDPESGWPRIAA